MGFRIPRPILHIQPFIYLFLKKGKLGVDRLKVNWLMRGLCASFRGWSRAVLREQHAFYCTFHSRDLRSCEEPFQVFKNCACVCVTGPAMRARIQPIPVSHGVLHRCSLTTRRHRVYPKNAGGNPRLHAGLTEANALCCEGTAAGGAPAQPHLW